jgi:tRNA A-37 threonylcarbamoyl transferase component Bud32
VAKTALVVAGVVLVAAGGAIAGYGATRTSKSGGMTPEASAAMSTAVGQLDGDIKAARASVHERAQTLAGIQQVQAGVATNVTTVTDMFTSGALSFKPQAGEVIEIGQVPNGKTPVTLLLQPDNAMRSSFAGKPGSYAELMGDRLFVTEVVTVVPADHANELSGYVAVSRPLDLGPALAALDKAHVAGSLAIGDKTRAIGTPPPNAVSTAMPLSSTPGAQLVVAVAPTVTQTATVYIAGGGGLAGLGLIVLVVGLVLGKRAQPQHQPAQPRTGITPAQFGSAETQLSSAASAVSTAAPAELGPQGSTANLGAGATLGRWEIVKRLGTGGMADVYLARALGEAGFAKAVAVKVMHPHLARNQRAVEHFLDEARLAAQISHPNVVQIQDLGKIGNDYVIVMEYVDGIDLERLLASARTAQRLVPIDVGLGILARICDGLEAAHRATTADGLPMNLVHRDVKSANVLVSRQGSVKVVDFGIAKAVSQSHLTVAGETKGTPSMMAPEQRVGDTVDVRADVYSVGAVAYEILTGHNVNLDVAALAHLGIENWPHLPMPTTQRPNLPPELDGLLMATLAFDRERRPASAAALGASFEGVMKRHGMSATDKDIARWVATELDRLAA